MSTKSSGRGKQQLSDEARSPPDIFPNCEVSSRSLSVKERASAVKAEAALAKLEEIYVPIVIHRPAVIECRRVESA